MSANLRIFLEMLPIVSLENAVEVNSAGSLVFQDGKDAVYFVPSGRC